MLSYVLLTTPVHVQQVDLDGQQFEYKIQNDKQWKFRALNFYFIIKYNQVKICF